MRWLAILLVVGVFVAHDAANWLSEGTRFSPGWVFYMLQGVWSALLSACLLIFFISAKPSLWRSLGIAGLAISIIEGAMVVGCALLVDDIYAVPRGTTLCHYATGLPIGSAITCLEVFILAWIVGMWTWRGDEE